MKLYRCPICGQIVTKVKDTKVPLVCCGKPMEELVAKEFEEGFNEKHIPTYSLDGNKLNVTLGSVKHPMLAEHYIEWIVVETNKGVQRKSLKSGDEPSALFLLEDDEKVEAIYAYCNLHSLWVKKA